MLKTLYRHLQGSPLAVAYSGGLDSRFLAYMAQKAGCDVVLFHVTGSHVPKEESAFAQEWAQSVALPLQLFSMDVTALEHVKDNTERRCYYCKKHVFQLLQQEALRQGRILCDGTNADDLQSHRPGLQALTEEEVWSPLAACGLSKAHIRAFAKETKLSMPEQKARPCLLTRLAYGMPVTAHILQNIEGAEKALTQAGLTDFRLRLTPAPVLQSIPHEISTQTLHTILAEYGFSSVQMLVQEQISGFFDKK